MRKTLPIFRWQALLAIALLTLLNAAAESQNLHKPQDLAEQLRPKIKIALAAMEVPGAVVLLRTPEGEWLEAFGYRQKNGKTKIRTNDYFRVGSVTKTWTGTVILQMVQEGLIGLADPVSRHIEGVPNGDKITIEQLLNMRSGLASYTTDRDFLLRLFAQPYRTSYPEELLGIALNQPALFEPGTDFNYSNTNTLLLGKIIERRTQSSLQREFHRRLFAPLGLKHTLMPPLEDTALPRPYAHGYTFDEGPSGTSTSSSPTIAANLRDATYWSSSWGWSAGMGISTAPDLARYVEHMVRGSYLNDTLQKRRLDSCFATKPGFADYCWGMARLDGFYGHTGELPGYNNFIGHEPLSRTTLVVWTSLSDTREGQSPAVELARLIIGFLHNRPDDNKGRQSESLPRLPTSQASTATKLTSKIYSTASASHSFCAHC